MPSVLIVYATDYGSTKAMAEAVAEGARSVAGTSVTLRPAEEATWQEVNAHDALVLGTPVHMGSPDWRVKKFIDTQCSGVWMRDTAVGKVGAVFATAGGFGGGGGGAEIALLALLNNLAELGMLLVPLPKNTPGYAQAGLQWGPCARTGDENMNPIGVQPAQLVSARAHGANIARVAAAVAGKGLLGG
jgi:NAD(P)H dehydrogenase (quinone)